MRVLRDKGRGWAHIEQKNKAHIRGNEPPSEQFGDLFISANCRLFAYPSTIYKSGSLPHIHFLTMRMTLRKYFFEIQNISIAIQGSLRGGMREIQS